MNVIGHHHVGPQSIKPLIPIQQSVFNQRRNRGLFEPQWAVLRSIEHVVSEGKQFLEMADLAVISGFARFDYFPSEQIARLRYSRECRLRKRVFEPPRQKDSRSLRLPVWQLAPIECSCAECASTVHR